MEMFITTTDPTTWHWHLSRVKFVNLAISTKIFQSVNYCFRLLDELQERILKKLIKTFDKYIQLSNNLK